MYRLATIIIYGCCAAPVLCAQAIVQAARMEDIQKDIKELFELNQYDKAVTLLERASADNPSDKTLLSLLGTAYLYSATAPGCVQNMEKARDAMEKAIEGGGEAVFLVSRAKLQSKLKRGPSIVTATPGELHISRKWLSFVPSRGEERAGPFSREDLKECGLNPGFGKDSNSFHIKASKETLDLRPLHFQGRS
jgi:hypothetical protein